MAFLPAVAACNDRMSGAIGLRIGVGFIVLPRFAVMRTDLSRDGTEPPDAKEVVSGTVQVSQKPGARDAAQFALSKSADRFEPTEDLFDPLAFSLRDAVTAVASGAAIESRSLAVVHAGDVRGDTVFSQARDKLAGVVGLVGTQGFRLHFLSTLARQQIQGARALGKAVGLSHLDADEKTVSVLHQRIAAEGKLRLLARTLFCQLGLGVSRAFMGGIRATLAMKVDGRVARVIGRTLRLFSLGPEALRRRPGLDQGAIDAEVFIGKQVLLPGEAHDGIEELKGRLVLDQPLAVLAEGTRVEGGLL